MLIGAGSRRRSARSAVDRPRNRGVTFRRLFTLVVLRAREKRPEMPIVMMSGKELGRPGLQLAEIVAPMPGLGAVDQAQRSS
jgi:hypothetical protein